MERIARGLPGGGEIIGLVDVVGLSRERQEQSQRDDEDDGGVAPKDLW